MLCSCWIVVLQCTVGLFLVFLLDCRSPVHCRSVSCVLVGLSSPVHCRSVCCVLVGLSSSSAL